MSILAGLSFGFIDKTYYKCCEDSIGIQLGGTNLIKIFADNYLISISELITIGISNLYFNFHTFSVASSYLNAQGTLYVLPIIFIVGIFELVGALCMGLVGFVFIEKKLLKIKSKLDSELLFFYGTGLIFLGAVIEYLLIQL
ncbi:MAG: hypothetical protein HYW22_00255 [Candidatus Aenigmarchaeota archaeon]|nr:hypothetical protein [Candidatus Aenigmarchaeota archaeon]